MKKESKTKLAAKNSQQKKTIRQLLEEVAKNKIVKTSRRKSIRTEFKNLITSQKKVRRKKVRRARNSRTSGNNTLSEIVVSGFAPPQPPELSGAQWVARFPTSTSVDDLIDPFKTSLNKFIEALTAAGATKSITATFRPAERAYLMHWSFRIARENHDAQAVPAMLGVNINWWHGNKVDSVAAAEAMVTGYGIVSRPALVSNHTKRAAADMNVAWTSTNLKIKDLDGTIVTISSTPKSHLNTDLHAVAKTYGVIKLVSDPPHWSVDGH